ncbi:hypothetical protein Taro_027011 [Colocasia esculenta]|uniref:Uncharacterized protein n=1 Tax=Colocasia esculenta TaxID=4460 RepID=A0A843VIV2_COLES|nr:hypothetical protein [Colocasia esculenta]
MSTNLACSAVMPNTLEIQTAMCRLNEFGCSSQDWIYPICTGIKSRESPKTQKVPADTSGRIQAPVVDSHKVAIDSY